MRPRKGRKVTFGPDPGAPTDNVAGLCFNISARLGGDYLADLRPLRPRLLALEFAAALRALTGPAGPWGARSTIRVVAGTIAKFFQYLTQTGDAIRGFDDLGAHHVEGFEHWLEKRGVTGVSSYMLLGQIVSLLRRIAESRSDPDRTLRDRLRYVSSKPLVRCSPRDALSPGIARRLREGAKSDMAAAIRRVAAEHVADRDPKVEYAHSVAHAAIVARGVIKHTDKELRQVFQVRTRSGRTSEHLAEQLHGAHYLLGHDVIAFLVHLSLETGLELECCRALKIDCLHNPSAGTVEIAYVKNRARGAEHKSIRVRDGGSTTPGGLIRKVINLTAAARRHVGVADLWLYYSDGRLRTVRGQTIHATLAWPRRHGILDDDGKPFHLRLSQLRKTHKALWYLKTQGHMARFAVGHTVEIAARHYADIPALRPLHEQTIVAALEDAAGPRIVTPDEEARWQATHLASRPNDQENFHNLVSGEQDVWLASCSDFLTSPFGTAGAPCPTPFWACLECSNAVITARKLPSILNFLAFIEETRERMTAVEWSSKFGRAHARITTQVLPAFDATAIDVARASLANESPSIYLPPEARA